MTDRIEFLKFMNEMNALGSGIYDYPAEKRWTCKRCNDTIPPAGRAGGTGTHTLCLASIMIGITDSLGEKNPGLCVACFNPVEQTELMIANHSQCEYVLENKARDLWIAHFVTPPELVASPALPEATEEGVSGVTALLAAAELVNSE